MNLNQQPIIVYNTDDDVILPGIFIGTNGIPQMQEVDEIMSQNNYIWVVSVNETLGYKPTGNGGSTQGPVPTTEDLIVKLESMTISDKKEGWGNGRGEVSIITFKYSFCGMPYWTSADLNNGKGIKCIEKVSNNELNQVIPIQDVYLADFSTDNDIFRPDERLGILLYERDKRKKAKFTHEILWASCFGFSFYYYSKESPYLSDEIYRNNFGLLSNWYQR